MTSASNRYDAEVDAVSSEARALGALVHATALPDLIERAHRLRAQVEEIEARAEHAAVRSLGVDEIAAALRAGEELDRRSRRLLPSLWSRLEPGLLVPHLSEAQLGRWRRSILSRFDEWRKLAPQVQARFVEAIDALEAASEDRLADWPFRSWVSEAGPDEIVASSRSRGDPFGARLGDFGLSDSWQYTGLVRARLLARELDGSAAKHVLQKLRQLDPVAFHRFVPAAAGTRELDRFRQQANHVDIVVTWLRAARGSGGSAAVIDQFLLDAFGDPLGPVVQRIRPTWVAAEHSDEAAYRAFLERMTRTDIEFFFSNQHGDDARARAEFWSQYVQRIRRTKIFLSGTDRQWLQPIAASATDPAYRQALARAGKIRASGASAFVLWFDQIVVVEFSRTGNATYLYSRKDYDARGVSMDTESIENERALKDLELGEKLIHQRGRWQQDFEHRLQQYGIDKPTAPTTGAVGARRRVAPLDSAPSKDAAG